MKKLTKEKFIEKAKLIHGDKYDYSSVEYVNAMTPVKIICPEHGEFWQTPNNHLRGCRCPRDSFNRRMDTNDFVTKAKLVHGDKYDYSKVEYVNSKTKICIICPEHGEFWQQPSMHLRGHGCPECAIKRLKRPYKKYVLISGRGFGFSWEIDTEGKLIIIDHNGIQYSVKDKTGNDLVLNVNGIKKKGMK